MTVIEMLTERGNKNQIRYKCICDCGNEHITSEQSLRSGRSNSCDCNKFNPPNKVEDREYAIKKQLYNLVIIVG